MSGGPSFPGDEPSLVAERRGTGGEGPGVLELEQDREAGPEGAVRSFALGQESFRPTARLAGLERMGERLARRIRVVVEPFSRAKAQVSAEPLETVRFEEFRDHLPGFTSVSLYRMRPLKGSVMLVIEPDFVTSMVDAFYGGSGAVSRHKGRGEFTPAEERLLGRLAEAVIEKVVEVWGEIAALTPVLASRETNAAYVSPVRADEPVVVQRFTVLPGQGAASVVSIVYPLAALRAYEAQLSAKVHADAGPADTEWRTRLEAALDNVHLPVRSVLARPELSVAQLMELKAGDVIPVTLSAKVPLIVANRNLGHGTIGEREGRVALMVEHIERGIRQ